MRRHRARRARATATTLASLALAACSDAPPTPQPAATPSPRGSSSTLAAEDSSAPPSEPAPKADEAAALRTALVAEIEKRPPWEGARWDARVLEAMRTVPRHRFVLGASLPVSYRDVPLDIGHEQTISQPTVVAIMAQALELEPSSRVLEIGTGSGYHAAVMSLLAREVRSIEIVETLGASARDRLARLGYANVHVRIGDGYAGWPEEAPFDRIILTAAPPELPSALVEQLAEGGVLVAPVGPEGAVQRLFRYRKRGGKLSREDLGAVRFVPMVRAR